MTRSRRCLSLYRETEHRDARLPLGGRLPPLRGRRFVDFDPLESRWTLIGGMLSGDRSCQSTRGDRQRFVAENRFDCCSDRSRTAT